MGLGERMQDIQVRRSEAPLHSRFGDAGPLVTWTRDEIAEEARTGETPQSIRDKQEVSAAQFHSRDPDPEAVARVRLREAIAEGQREDAEERERRERPHSP